MVFEAVSVGLVCTRNHYNDCSARENNMFLKKSISLLAVAGLCAGQSGKWEHPVRQAVRGVHGAVAAGSDYATEAGMKIYYKGGNAVDAGVGTMFAAAVTELSHFGMGGEAPILIRTKAGKVFSIAGVGTMPKLATAEMFRTRPLRAGEILEMDPGGLKGIIPVAGIMPALVPGMVDSGLVALREFGTKSFNDVIGSAIDLADGFAIDEMRANSLADVEGAFPDQRSDSSHRRDFPAAGSGPDAARDGRSGEKGIGQRREPSGCDRRGSRLFLSR
jgi:gamma-glutamyltranspeptidase